MKRIIFVALAAIALLLAIPLPGDARGGYSHGSRFYFSGGVLVSPGWGASWGPSWGPWWGPGWVGTYPFYYPYYYPYYYAPPVVIRQSPTVYFQRDSEAQEPYYWYYCRKPQGYYPYVKKCPNGWTKVVPSPTPPDREE